MRCTCRFSRWPATSRPTEVPRASCLEPHGQTATQAPPLKSALFARLSRTPQQPRRSTARVSRSGPVEATSRWSSGTARGRKTAKPPCPPRSYLGSRIPRQPKEKGTKWPPAIQFSPPKLQKFWRSWCSWRLGYMNTSQRCLAVMLSGHPSTNTTGRLVPVMRRGPGRCSRRPLAGPNRRRSPSVSRFALWLYR